MAKQKIKGIPDKPVANAKQQKNIDHYKAKGTTPRASTPAGQFALSTKMWEAKYGEEYRREVRRLEIEASKTPETKQKERISAAKIREMLKKADPEPATHRPQTKKAVEGYVERTTKTLEAQKGRPQQIASKVAVLELADEPPRLPEKAGRQAKARKGGKAAAGKQVKFSGLPSWRDVVPDESTEKGRYLKGRMKNLAFFEKRLAQMEMDKAGPRWARLSGQEKKERIAKVKRRLNNAKQAITDVHKPAGTKTLHGGIPATVKYPWLPRAIASRLPPIPKDMAGIKGGPGWFMYPAILFDEWKANDFKKPPAIVESFLDIPNLPTYIAEAFKEIRDAIRRNDEKAGRDAFKHMMRRQRQFYPAPKKRRKK